MKVKLLLELDVPDEDLRRIAEATCYGASMGRATASCVRWYALQLILKGLGRDAFPNPQRISVRPLPLTRRTKSVGAAT
jgi:hypothetical protein